MIASTPPVPIQYSRISNWNPSWALKRVSWHTQSSNEAQVSLAKERLPKNPWPDCASSPSNARQWRGEDALETGRSDRGRCAEADRPQCSTWKNRKKTSMCGAAPLTITHSLFCFGKTCEGLSTPRRSRIQLAPPLEMHKRIVRAWKIWSLLSLSSTVATSRLRSCSHTGNLFPDRRWERAGRRYCRNKGDRADQWRKTLQTVDPAGRSDMERASGT